MRRTGLEQVLRKKAGGTLVRPLTNVTFLMGNEKFRGAGEDEGEPEATEEDEEGAVADAESSPSPRSRLPSLLPVLL